MAWEFARHESHRERLAIIKKVIGNQIPCKRELMWGQKYVAHPRRTLQLHAKENCRSL